MTQDDQHNKAIQSATTRLETTTKYNDQPSGIDLVLSPITIPIGVRTRSNLLYQVESRFGTYSLH